MPSTPAREREGHSERVCVIDIESVRRMEREREKERERVCVCNREREKERERECVCVIERCKLSRKRGRRGCQVHRHTLNPTGLPRA